MTFTLGQTAEAAEESFDLVFINHALAKLDEIIANYKSCVTAFSGGIDSTFLAARVNHVLGYANALAITANSPSLARSELEECALLVQELNLAWIAVPTSELENPLYVQNNYDRCFHCKSELMKAILPIAEMRHATVLLAVNLDDLNEYRPGQTAAKQAGAQFPLAEAGFTKQMVRQAAKLMGISIYDKPAMPCLSSRIPNGTPVTINTLEQIAQAESELRKLGIKNLRVRHHSDLARVEVAITDIALILDQREQIIECVKKAGYKYVTLDLEGFRSGSTASGPK